MKERPPKVIDEPAEQENNREDEIEELSVPEPIVVPESNRNSDGTFKEGQSGNPSGRPKGSVSLKWMLLRKMEEVPLGQVKSWAEQVVESILTNAIVKGDTQAQKLILNYIDGLPDQSVDLTTQGEKLNVKLTIDDAQFEQLIRTSAARIDSKEGGN